MGILKVGVQNMEKPIWRTFACVGTSRPVYKYAHLCDRHGFRHGSTFSGSFSPLMRMAIG